MGKKNDMYNILGRSKKLGCCFHFSFLLAFWKSTSYILSAQAVLQEIDQTGIFISSSFSRVGGWFFSYFNKGNLELTVAQLGNLDEECWLVGVVLDDVVIHVDKDPVGETNKKTGLLRGLWRNKVQNH